MAQNTASRLKNTGLSIRETVIFALLGAMMYVSDLMMEALPNIHLLGVFIVAATVVYRVKALYPIYVYVFLYGITMGFGVWWVPYLYVWTILWAMTMLLPKRMPKWLAPVAYCLVSGLHGICFGTIYAPAQALLMGFSFKQTLAWIAAGFYFDVTHAIGNICLGVLIVPLIHTLRLADKAGRKE